MSCEGQGRTVAGGRTRGVVRVALTAWAEQWRASGRDGGLTAAELAAYVPGISARSPADMRLMRDTVCNMVRAGELVSMGSKRAPPARRPHAIYAPAPVADSAPALQPSALLGAVFGAWRHPAGGTDPAVE